MRNPALRYGAMLFLVLLCMYALLQNGYWASSGMSDLYMTAARNIVTGSGYTFNGEMVVHYPPGWSLFLAGILRLTPSFWAFNAIAKLLLLAAAILCYILLLRMTTPRRAFICVLVSATLWWWYSNGYMLHSESLFLFMLAAALLLAQHVAEGRGTWWKMALIVILCACLASIRWLGVLTVAAVAALLLSGELKPRWNRQWLCMVLSVAATFVTFAVLYGATKGMNRDDPVLWSTYRFPLNTGSSITNQLANLYNAGIWMADALWPPTKKIGWSPALLTCAGMAGWALWPFIVISAVSQARRRKWLLAGMLLYVVVLMGRWPVPEGRYLVPFMPVFLLAFWNGWDIARDRLQTEYSIRTARWSPAVPAVLFSSIILCNLALYAIEAKILRSRDFYAAYLAGEYKALVSVSERIRQETPPGEPIAINSLYRNMGSCEYNQVGAAATAMLTDRTMRPTPLWVGHDGATPELIQWAQKKRIRYFLFRAPISPWRLWHFRVPGLQARLTGKRDIPVNPYWILYRIEDGRALELPVNGPTQELTRVPDRGR